MNNLNKFIYLFAVMAFVSAHAMEQESMSIKDLEKEGVFVKFSQRNREFLATSTTNQDMHWHIKNLIHEGAIIKAYEADMPAQVVVDARKIFTSSGETGSDIPQIRYYRVLNPLIFEKCDESSGATCYEYQSTLGAIGLVGGVGIFAFWYCALNLLNLQAGDMYN